jgi:hypothetical protein
MPTFITEAPSAAGNDSGLEKDIIVQDAREFPRKRHIFDFDCFCDCELARSSLRREWGGGRRFCGYARDAACRNGNNIIYDRINPICDLQ